MAQFYTSHFHCGWYDTQFCVPMVVQHSYPYHTSPFPILLYSKWINAPQLHGGSPPTDTPQTPKTDPSPPNPIPETTTPIKRPLRSILKHPQPIPIGSQAPRKKFVRFTSSTASPPLAAPGTYKHTGRPKPPRARHPARSHPCLISALQQRAQEATAAGSGPPPVSKQVSNTSTSLRGHPCVAGDAVRPRSRPPTPPPAAFFRGPDHSLPRQCNISAPRQPAPSAALKSQVPAPVCKVRNQTQTRTQIPQSAYSISYAGPYSSDSEDSNTDVRLATKMRVKKAQPTQMEVKAIAMTKTEEVAATRRSLKALAREFDRKNAWRRGGE
jgi:hypothetical protein